MNAWVMRLVVVCVIAACGGTHRSTRTPYQLRSSETAFRDGKFDEGLRQFAIEKPKLPAFQQKDFIAKHEPALLAEIEAREKRGDNGAAYVLAVQVAATFESQGARKQLADLGARWTTSLAAAIEKHEQAKHPATALLLRAVRAAVTKDGSDATAARTAYAELTAKHRLTVEARGDAAKLTSVLARDKRFADGGAERVTLALKLGQPASKKDVKRQNKTAQIEQGTRAVDNPARAQAEDRVAGHEERIASLREERQMEEQSPTRSQGSLDMIDYQTRVEQGDLDAAREDLKATPATVQEANFVDFNYEVEIHTLAVTRDVELEVKFASGAPITLRETVRVVKEDTANAAQPQIKLARKTANLPDQRAVMPELDAAVDKWSAAAGDKIYDAYRARVLAATSDRGEGIALVVVLGDAAQASELEKLLGVPRPDRVIAALDHDQLDTAFAPAAEAKPAKTASSAKPAPATAKPTPTTAKPTPATPTTAKPTPATPATPAPKPAPAVDLVRAKGGRALAVAAFEVRRGKKVIAIVDRDGKISARGQVTGVWRAADGVLEDMNGRAILAVDKRGGVWLDDKGVKQAARLQGNTLLLENGITIAIDGGGYVILTRGKEREISSENIRPASKQEMALLVAMLLTTELHFNKAP